MYVREKLVGLICRFCGGLTVSDITPPYGYENLADFMISNGVTVQEWIPISECLPQKDGRYLVIINNVDRHQSIGIRWFAKDGEMIEKNYISGKKYTYEPNGLSIKEEKYLSLNEYGNVIDQNAYISNMKDRINSLDFLKLLVLQLLQQIL